MTVKELIQILHSMPLDMDVRVVVGDSALNPTLCEYSKGFSRKDSNSIYLTPKTGEDVRTDFIGIFVD